MGACGVTLERPGTPVASDTACSQPTPAGAAGFTLERRSAPIEGRVYDQ